MGVGESSELIRAEAVRGAAPGPAWSFALAPGAALWIPDGEDAGLAWLDWLTGIEPPPHGQVFWKGVEWRDRGPAAAAAERGRLGCVFAAGGLLAQHQGQAHFRQVQHVSSPYDSQRLRRL